MHKKYIAALLFSLLIVSAGGIAALFVEIDHSFLPVVLHVPPHPICPTPGPYTPTPETPPPETYPGPSTPTPTPIPWCVASPVLADIINEDNSSAYFVRWSPVRWAERYKLEVNHNNTVWNTDYEGPAIGITKLHMADGQYCYRVSASNTESYTSPSEEKCTIVGSGSLPRQ